MNNKEIRKEVIKLINKCVYFDICDFIDVVYTHFEKMGIFNYKTIDVIINELEKNIIYKK